MYLHEKKALKLITARLRKDLRSKIVALCAFGSRVRGDFDERSDFDVLVVVRDKTPELEKRIISIFVDEEIKIGLSFTPVIKDVHSFELEKKFNSPFYQNVMKEGISL